MTEPITDNIDGLVLRPLSRPLGYELTFRSAPENAGMYHQLYSNGRLVDVTDAPAQRSFELTADDVPHELAVAAVSPENRLVDFAESLPEAVRKPPWVYRARLIRNISHQPGDILAIYHDNAAGQIQPTPTVQKELWPQAEPHWSWGHSSMGIGGFGLGGANAPGLGGGVFGRGPFGLDANALEADLALCIEGTHKVALKVHTADGETSAAHEEQFEAHPPPASPTALILAGYEPATHKVTLNIEE